MSSVAIKTHGVKPVLCSLLLMVGALCVQTAFAQSFSVIVNASNDYSASEEEMKHLIKRLFLKQENDWPNGEYAQVFSRDAKSPELSQFTDSILAMNSAQVARHWLSLKQKTGETPPRSISSTRMLLRTLERYPGAVGLVDEETAKDLPGSVKVLFSY